MGSLPVEPEFQASGKDYNVLVTGFGAFLEHKSNPSYLIATALPKQIILPNQHRIRIHIYHNPVAVSYATVRSLVPELLKEANYDLTFNIGMASSRSFYSLETKAHRNGYEKKDIHGETPKDPSWQDKHNDAPAILQPTYNPEDVWRRWKSGVVADDVRLSDDAGRYLCEYILYACMLEFWLRDPAGKRPCAFLHVPQAGEPEDISRGVRIALAAIGAVVESLMARRGGEREPVYEPVSEVEEKEEV